MCRCERVLAVREQEEGENTGIARIVGDIVGVVKEKIFGDPPVQLIQ